MQVLLVFLLASVLMGGSAAGHRLVRRPVLVLGATLVVAASFYSIRVVS